MKITASLLEKLIEEAIEEVSQENFISLEDLGLSLAQLVPMAKELQGSPAGQFFHGLLVHRGVQPDKISQAQLKQLGQDASARGAEEAASVLFQLSGMALDAPTAGHPGNYAGDLGENEAPDPNFLNVAREKLQSFRDNPMVQKFLGAYEDELKSAPTSKKIELVGDLLDKLNISSEFDNIKGFLSKRNQEKDRNPEDDQNRAATASQDLATAVSEHRLATRLDEVQKELYLSALENRWDADALKLKSRILADKPISQNLIKKVIGKC